MSSIVIDTNVLLVADGKAGQMSEACRIECIERLQKIQSSERVVVDDSWLIVGEYHKKITPNNSSMPGSAFLKWLLQFQGNDKHVSRVKVTPRDPECTLFEEFPLDGVLEASFDPADRKFIAVANAHPEKPPVLESADSKWLGWEPRLNACGITIEFLCRKELEAIRQRKTKSS